MSLTPEDLRPGPVLTAVLDHMGERLDELATTAAENGDTVPMVLNRIIALAERHGLGIGGVQILLAIAVRRIADTPSPDVASLTHERFGG